MIILTTTQKLIAQEKKEPGFMKKYGNKDSIIILNDYGELVPYELFTTLLNAKANIQFQKVFNPDLKRETLFYLAGTLTAIERKDNVVYCCLGEEYKEALELLQNSLNESPVSFVEKKSFPATEEVKPKIRNLKKKAEEKAVESSSPIDTVKMEFVQEEDKIDVFVKKNKALGNLLTTEEDKAKFKTCVLDSLDKAFGYPMLLKLNFGAEKSEEILKLTESSYEKLK